MADQDGVTGQLRRADSPWRAVGLFLLLTGFLSGIFWVLINAHRPRTRTTSGC